jgi:hypothetical protein
VLAGAGLLLIAAAGAPAAIVPPTLNWEANFDTPGDNFWDSTLNATNTRRWNFGGAKSPTSVSDPVLMKLSEAYTAPSATMASFDSLGFGGTNPSQQNATFELVIRALNSDLQSGVTRAVMETGGDGDGIAFLLRDGDLFFRVQQYNPGGGAGGVPNNAGDVLAQISTPFPTDGNFHQIVGTISVGGDEASLYLDGQLVGQSDALIQFGANLGDPGNLTDWAGSNGAGLGEQGGGSTAGKAQLLGGSNPSDLAGSVAIARFYRNQALTADQVFQNYAALVPEPATLAVWSLLAAAGIGLGWRRRTR